MCWMPRCLRVFAIDHVVYVATDRLIANCLGSTRYCKCRVAVASLSAGSCWVRKALWLHAMRWVTFGRVVDAAWLLLSTPTPTLV